MGPDGPLVSEASEECHIDSLILHAKCVHSQNRRERLAKFWVRIAQIIGRISRDVYCVGEAGNTDQMPSAHWLVNELHAWRASLPAHLGTVKPSTLIPSFRREATALNLAYAHAVIHATRPFLLGNGSSSSDEQEVQNGILECISAARRVLELVNTMANYKNLFYSFWWTQYILFCALAVVYVWEIQQSASENNQLDKSYASLFSLAEKCQSYLLQGSFAAPPNHRYSVILEELRLEAQQETLRKKTSLSNPVRPSGNKEWVRCGGGLYE